MQNILIFTSDNVLRGSVAAIQAKLEQAGYAVAANSLDARQTEPHETICNAFGGQPPDLVLADLTDAHDCLPLRYVRRCLSDIWGENLPTVPSLALFGTHHLSQPDWPAHTDDFLLPPYTPEEALARVKLLLFRKRHIRDDNTLCFADVIIRLDSEQATDDKNQVLPLRPREFELLRFLVTHKGKFFSRNRLLDLVWGIDFEGSERTVDIHVTRLRTKLPPEAADRLETRRGVGYGFRI